jgi:hypothetical protein
MTQQLSKTEEISVRTGSALRKLNQELQKRHFMLGVYHASAAQKKKRQQQWSDAQGAVLGDVLNEVWKASATSLLVDFDRTWWALRGKLDDYLDASDQQDRAFRDAVSLLNDYTSKCTAHFHSLKWAHARALKANKAAHVQLRQTWQTVESEVGLLAAKIADSAAFHQLQRLDADSVDLSAQKSVLCSSDFNAAVSAVNETLSGGLADQTWGQIESVVMETPVLMERFVAGGLKPPAGQALLQAWQRLSVAYLEAKQERAQHAEEMVKQFRKTNCYAYQSWFPSSFLDGLAGLGSSLFR